MYIESINVKDFGTIEQLEVWLDNRLNVISGSNETGKSTLMRAAWLCLMWPHRSQSEELTSPLDESRGFFLTEKMPVSQGLPEVLSLQVLHALRRH
jgi:recombinational DNA repair ATPase RecF